jgi:hypothetical protein
MICKDDQAQHALSYALARQAAPKAFALAKKLRGTRRPAPAQPNSLHNDTFGNIQVST